jgi:hypothetical protein
MWHDRECARSFAASNHALRHARAHTLLGIVVLAALALSLLPRRHCVIDVSIVNTLVTVGVGCRFASDTIVVVHNQIIQSKQCRWRSSATSTLKHLRHDHVLSELHCLPSYHWVVTKFLHH